MTDDNRLRAAIESDRPSIGTHLHTFSPSIVEVIGQVDGIDYIEFLVEYAPYDEYDLANVARACELMGLSSMAKIDGESRTYVAQRVLAAGIQNLLFSQITSVEDARQAVRAVRPGPSGGNVVRMDRRIDYLGYDPTVSDLIEASERAVVALMIEKESAVENIEDIVAVEGVDMVVFGPSDYAMSAGLGDDPYHPEVEAAKQRTYEAALDAGVTPRPSIPAPDAAEEYLEMGIQHFAIGWDVVSIHEWLEANVGELSERL